MQTLPSTQEVTPKNRVLFASLIGTTIEFFDFYIYATAAVLVFPILFFPADDPAAATLQSLATFAIAFFARPLGSAVFGHYGDKLGRKTTLVAALLTMGLSTVAIGLLPTYVLIGVWAPLLLALCRFGQGLGLGGEWGGAVLLATENAPPGQRAWYGMFPQLGAPIGFILSTSLFLLLTSLLSSEDFMSWGWRIPFLASSLLVLVGLYVRLRITETPAFLAAKEKQEAVGVPLVKVFKDHKAAMLAGTLIAISAFVIFYLMTVFTLSWGTSQLGYSREEFLEFQLFGVVFFALAIPVSAYCADRFGWPVTMRWVAIIIILFGASFSVLFGSGHIAGVLATLALGFTCMGLTYGPLGTLLSDLFPTHVRYTGSSLAFNLAGILGASIAPFTATWLATHWGLMAVGAYIALAGALGLLGLNSRAVRYARGD